ncbi:MAG TPA: glycosyltransferase family 2 protein [Phycisphaerae bacterium]|nr:glycosyltransferase family 2 protein [Phycisphaerae bacterium]
MELGIVIVNYKSAGLAIECLQSLAPEMAQWPGSKVIVVENASGDGSGEKLARAIIENAWFDWARLIVLDKNTGYAGGNNVGIRALLNSPDPPRYVHLLNPDTYIRAGAIKELHGFMEAHPHVGICGSRLEDPDTTPQRSAFRFPSVWTELDSGLRLGIVSKVLKHKIAAPPVRDDAHESEWVAGASMMIRREVFDKIGMLDERYFLYYEEVDFCLAAKRAGWPTWYVPASHVVHLVGQSSGVTDTRRAPSRRPPYWFESRRLFFLKNRGRLQAIIADLAFSAGFLLWRLRRPLQRKPDLDPPYLLRDMFRHSALLRGMP